MKKVIALMLVVILSTPVLVEAKMRRAHAVCQDGYVSYRVLKKRMCMGHGGVQTWLY